MGQSVILFGDSITRGQVSASFIGILRRRLSPLGYDFINHGVNNDTSYNLLRRVRRVVECCPDYITILIGTNDLIASRTDASAAFYVLNKRIPQKPTMDWTIGNLRQIIRRLKSHTSAKIALLSIPMLGEDLDTPENDRVREYNLELRHMASKESLTYLPVYESLVRHLEDMHGKPFRPSAPVTAEFLARRLLYNESFDQFSHRKGYHLLLDGVHLNRRAAEIVARLIESFIRSEEEVPLS